MQAQNREKLCRRNLQRHHKSMQEMQIKVLKDNFQWLPIGSFALLQLILNGHFFELDIKLVSNQLKNYDSFIITMKIISKNNFDQIPMNLFF